MPNLRRLLPFLLLTFFVVMGIIHTTPVQAHGENLDLIFFYSPTCPHCAEEEEFLDDVIEVEYPEVDVHRYIAYAAENQELLQELAEKHNAEKSVGVVPLTFIGDDLFIGFDDADGIGKLIRNSIERQLAGESAPLPEKEETIIRVPFLGEINISDYSLPILAIILGFLDGFNVCSLGALILILGLVLTLRSRKKILLFGGTFVVTTAIVYGLLIVLWYQLFSLMAPYVRTMEIVVGLLGLVGAAFFLRQFIRFRKYGPTCEATSGDSLVSRWFKKIQGIFENPGSALVLVGSVLLFAAVITIVEFPCSAAVPVIFAGVLSQAQLPGFTFFFYIALFILFYMLDELIIFLIAVFKLDVWLASPKFVTWITLAEAIILGALGFYYLLGVV